MTNMFDTIFIVLGLVIGAFFIYLGLVFFDDAERINCKRTEVYSYFIMGCGLYILYKAFDLIQYLTNVYTLL